MAHKPIPHAVSPLQSRKDFAETPTGQFKYWEAEIKAAQTAVYTYQQQGDRIVQRYLDERTNYASTITSDHAAEAGFRLNLFHANTSTLISMLYGNLPKIDVKRRFSDPDDDIARVAGEMMERLLNNDIQQYGQDYDSVLRAVLQDRLIPGLGVARVRYDVEIARQEQGEMEGYDEVINESAPVEYYHWRDVLWGWSRTWADVPWVGFRTYMSIDEATTRFGAEVAKNLEYRRQRVNENEDAQTDPDKDSAWEKAEIWELWDKIKRKVYWVSLGAHAKTLDSRDDPLKLTGFFPCPAFFLANATTTHYIPKSDFHLSQDLYNEIDVLQTRISIITQAVKVVGVYDRSAEGIQRMFKEGTENDMIPVDNWAMFSEKGGIKGQIEWVPVMDIVNSLDKLRQLRDENISLLQQITGMSDIMKGQLSGQYEGVGQTQLKTALGSVRVQRLQDEFARFAGDLMQLKAEVIARHFEPERILELSNMQYGADQDKLHEAVMLIKDPDKARLRVEIRPESVAMIDYQAIKAERTEYIGALSQFVAAASPLMESDPASKPFLLRLLQWGLAGFKGASEIEGVVDQAIAASEKEAQGPEKPDPEQQRMEQQMQMQMQLEQAKVQSQMQLIEAKKNADLEVRKMDMQADIQTAMAEHQKELERIQADSAADLMQIAAKLRADVETEIAQSQANVEQSALSTEGEIRKEAIKTALDIEKMEIASRIKSKEAKTGAD